MNVIKSRPYINAEAASRHSIKEATYSIVVSSFSFAPIRRWNARVFFSTLFVIAQLSSTPN